jgi:diguanylate cyclase (GGDEF)-like protein/PAS domain S-box-containing protein
MIQFRPATKVTLGLVLMTTSLLLIGDLLGFVPNEERGLLEGRKRFCEALAVQLSTIATRRDTELLKTTLGSLVGRNEDILSAGFRTVEGRLLAEGGQHAKEWVDIPLDTSTSTHVQVPIFKGNNRWGTLEVHFAPLQVAGGWFGINSALIRMLLFMTLFGYLLYSYFIRKTLRELDPKSVIPERVKSAFDALAEGLVIVDEKEQIILANSSFADKVERPPDSLIGRKASELGFEREGKKKAKVRLPWERSLSQAEKQTGIPLKFRPRKGASRTFMVNSAPITDGKGKTRGALATFDDMTDLERKQTELKETIGNLSRSEQELRGKTVELEFLATRDPLSGCLNRRAFFEKLEVLFLETKETGGELTSVMVDIDHFKSINDRYGHATGDKVIQIVAEVLRANARPSDLLCRYGGEEFCLMLSGANLDAGVVMADRLRQAIHQGTHARFTSSARITASFGVASIHQDVSDPAELINRADQALYAAKESGRNRVIRWGEEEGATVAAEVRDGATLSLSAVEGQSGDLSRQGLTQVRTLQKQILELESQLEIREQALRTESGKDPLTGLPNRVLFYDRIKQAVARGHRYDRTAAIVSLDIDMFKRVNEALGQAAGDQLLKTAAEQLREVLRSVDTVARLDNNTQGVSLSRIGSDEFGILLTDLKDSEAVTWIMKRLLDRLSQRLKVDSHEVFITCSAGISLYPHDSDDPAQLLLNASSARHRAKQQMGRSNFCFYSADINQASYKQLWFESQLHRALEGQEFLLHYQPRVDLLTGEILSMEALIRWQHPKLGMVPPNEFIPIADYTGLILPIGDWVLRAASRECKRWHEQGFSNLRVAVNLSALQFRHHDLAERILDGIAAVGLAPERLELEITETAIMENLAAAIKTITMLHDSGIQFAIDDFGTGYSSLSYLRQLPVDSLKIDRSFLSDTLPGEQDQLIISAIIAMAHSLDMRVVAEGVETEAQRTFLTGLNCDEIQGYLFSKPLPADQANALLQTHAYRQTGSAA